MTFHNLAHVHDKIWGGRINYDFELWGLDRYCKTLSGLPRFTGTCSLEMDLSRHSRKRNVVLLTATVQAVD
jgi:hypothetical protein